MYREKDRRLIMTQNSFYGMTMDRFASLNDADRAKVIAIYRRERMYKEFKAWFVRNMKQAVAI